MSDYWHRFFEQYRLVEIRDDRDLYYQVGKSVGGKPIDEAAFRDLLADILGKLEVGRDDVVLDLCCGNGVITYELGAVCRKVIGIDFSRPYIENARRYKARENLSYHCDNVLNAPAILGRENAVPNRILMHGSLAYLSRDDFAKLMRILRTHAPPGFRMLISGVPDAAQGGITTAP